MGATLVIARNPDPDSSLPYVMRVPRVPIMFCETRPLAEEWTYRFLGAAIALETHPANTRAAEAAGTYSTSEDVPPEEP